MTPVLLIHSADPQLLQVVITIVALGVCTSVRLSVPTFQNLRKQNKFQGRIVIATGGIVGLAEWIIDGTCLVCIVSVDGKVNFTRLNDSDPPGHSHSHG